MYRIVVSQSDDVANIFDPENNIGMVYGDVYIQ